jgi:peptide-methionine (S)-S-oxide reductase
MTAEQPPVPTLETATLGGGCFWCLDSALQQLQGVVSVTSGYCGGHTSAPNYRDICDGDSGHAEVVQIAFDPATLDFRDLLLAFFTIHDPTTLNRQGNDVGTQYRSAIFTHSDKQAQTAHALIAELSAQNTWSDPVVTTVLPAPKFWPAEDYHQNYFAKNPHQPYCLAVVQPKVAKLRQLFHSRLKT